MTDDFEFDKIKKKVKPVEPTTFDPPPTPAPEPAASPFNASSAGAPQFTGNEFGNFDTIRRIPVQIQVVLGSATMPVAALMKLGRGAIVPLDHRVGEPVDVVVNGRVIARGEVVVVEDDNSRFGVQLTEIVGPQADEGNN